MSSRTLELLMVRIIRIVTPTVARALVTWMRKMEEANPDATTRWADLRDTLRRLESHA